MAHSTVRPEAITLSVDDIGLDLDFNFLDPVSREDHVPKVLNQVCCYVFQFRDELPQSRKLVPSNPLPCTES